MSLKELVNNIYATENKHLLLLWIYAVVKQVTLHPKDIYVPYLGWLG